MDSLISKWTESSTRSRSLYTIQLSLFDGVSMRAMKASPLRQVGIDSIAVTEPANQTVTHVDGELLCPNWWAHRFVVTGQNETVSLWLWPTGWHAALGFCCRAAASFRVFISDSCSAVHSVSVERRGRAVNWRPAPSACDAGSRARISRRWGNEIIGVHGVDQFRILFLLRNKRRRRNGSLHLPLLDYTIIKLYGTF